MQLFIPPPVPRSQPSSTAQLHLIFVPALHQQQHGKWAAKSLRKLENIHDRKAGDEVKGASLASNAFFPIAWNDTMKKVCEANVGVVTEHGGSIRNKDTIEYCNSCADSKRRKSRASYNRKNENAVFFLSEKLQKVMNRHWSRGELQKPFVPDGTNEKFDGNGSDAIGIKGYSSAPFYIDGHKSDAINIDKNLVGYEKDIENNVDF
ncbi:hypothetical protein POTOM_060149 [Populus tomentosa]|uniref:Uncharacterized protein n=1 Tax=Populus tomentosa TaxID=118781 RepID=A0A8X8C0L7_POPTO|nr:hypothetical protein POTOM_060149 [Populus tomentosa]